MSTELKRFTEAYATMTVAAYEPLILRWVSLLGVRFMATEVSQRIPKAKAMKFVGKGPAALALANTMRAALPGNIDVKVEGKGNVGIPIELGGRGLDPASAKPVKVAGFPQAVLIGRDVHLRGVTLTDPALLLSQDAAHLMKADVGGAGVLSRALGGMPSATQVVKDMPMSVSRRLGVADPTFDYRAAQVSLQEGMVKAAQEWVRQPDQSLTGLMEQAMNIEGIRVPVMWPGLLGVQEALSPIGIAHYYRQLYFNKEEGVGPIEQAFTIAPLETLEVIYQTVRRQIHEEILEQGLEVISEAATEEKNLDEVSDKVSSMVQQDTSASMSANASGGIGVWQVGASASAEFKVSSQRGREYSARRLKEITKRASERITKSFSIKTTDTTEITETTTTRRVIRNDGAAPVSYGLRRVLRRVNVKVQDLGPRLVWQLYLRNPGEGLARSRFVHFREAQDLTVPDLPPGLAPRPAGGVETESASTNLKWDAVNRTYYVTLVIKPGSDRDVTGVRIDSITDLEGGGKDDLAPSPRNEFNLGSSWNPATRTYTANLAVLEGDAASVQVTYTYTWEPSAAVLSAWETQRAAAVAAITEEKMTKQFEQNKALITEKSKIKARPANDLRREERYEVMNRMVSYLFGRSDDPSEPTPLEIEFFHRYFDIDAIFTYTHPSWWKPRFTSRTVGPHREAYEITAESDPAPLGSSLGWAIQLDGDRRRNEFLNSPWARICVPMRPGREREAVAWLARYMEGEVGYDAARGKLAELLGDIEKFRAQEEKLGQSGADYVTVDSTPGAPADPLEPEGVYPIIDEFEVTVPTEGFVYDELKVVIP